MKSAMVLLALLAQDPQDKKVDLEKTKLFVYDASKGLRLRVHEDGRVELAVTEEGRTKTYGAANAEEFSKEHPDLVRRHGLRKYLGETARAEQDEFDRLWEELKKPRFRGFAEENLKKFFEDQEKQMEELRKLFRQLDPADPAPAPPPPPVPPGREFGIKVDSVGETLRDQLNLKEGEGVVVGTVKPGSVAEKAGVKPYDIVLRIDGKPAGDKWQFRTDVLDAMAKPEFDLEVIRGGKRETLKVKTEAKKD